MTTDNTVVTADIETADTATEEVVEETSTSTNIEDKDAIIADLRSRNERLYARLQREKGREQSVVQTTPAAPQPEVDQSFILEQSKLIAKGLTDEEIAYANKIAKLEGLAPSKAMDSDLFKLWKDNKDKEEKAKQAQLSAARGARSGARKSFSSKGLSDEEHRELWSQKMNS